MADYALPFSLSGMWKKKADVLPPETLHQVFNETRVAPSLSDNSSIIPYSPYRFYSDTSNGMFLVTSP